MAHAIDRTRISIHAPRMGSDLAHLGEQAILNKISIHAPRMGSDRPRNLSFRDLRISIHAPRMGSDLLLTRVLMLAL